MLKRTIAILLAAVLALSLGGCVQSVQTLAGVEDETENSTEQVERTDTVGVPYRAASTLNPLVAENEFNLEVSHLIFDCLYDVGEDFVPTPKLATASTPDGQNYTLLIKEGVKFHDGSDLTADDVVASLNKARTTEGSPYQARLSHVTSVTADGRYGVSIALDRVDYRFVSNLTIPVVKDGSTAKNAVGSGRYRPEGEVLTANDEWAFRETDFSIRTIKLVDIEDYDSLVNKAGNGEIDMFKLTDDDFSKVSVPGGFSYRSTPTNELVYLGVNMKNTHLQAAEFRRALSLDIDRSEILEDVLQKNGYVTQSVINPSYALFSAGTGAELTGEKSGELLTALGYTYGEDGALLRGGKQVTLRLLAPQGQSNLSAVADKIAVRLQELGIAVEQETIASDKYRSALRKGDFDLYIAECKLTPDMDTGVLLETGVSLNYGKYTSEEMDAAIRAVREAPDQETLAAAVGTELSLFARELPVIPLYFNTSTLLTRRKFGMNMKPSPYDFFRGVEVS